MFTHTIFDGRPNTKYCGDCNEPATNHPVVINQGTEFEYTVCNRTHDSIGNLDEYRNVEAAVITGTDYDSIARPDYDTDNFAFEDYSGPQANDYSSGRTEYYRNGDTKFKYWAGRDDEYDYESYDSTWESVDRYVDRNPEEHTLATHWWVGSTQFGKTREGEYPMNHIARTSTSPVSPEPESRTVFVEGNDGYLTIQAYDYYLTELFHNRLLNFFKNKQGDYQVGSMRLDWQAVDGKGQFVKATCVKCKASATVITENLIDDTYELTREAMENFTLAVIQHGNNHAANWFVNRPTFYKVHASDCDLDKCNSHNITDKNFAACLVRKPQPEGVLF